MRSPRIPLPSALRHLPRRRGPAPSIAVRYPCLQVEQMSPLEIRRALIDKVCFPGVTLVPVGELGLDMPAVALVLSEELAQGQPEAFFRGRAFALVRLDGSIELRLPPEWARPVLRRGWGTIHPLARYLAGAVPPQSFIIYAPRTLEEVRAVTKIVAASYWYARGEVAGTPLPGSAW